MKNNITVEFTVAVRLERARRFMEEYRRLARLVDDLDIRFWKRYIMRDCMRSGSIDTELSEERLRREYKSCVADLIEMQGQVYSALDNVTSTIGRELVLEHYVRDISIEELERKWDMPVEEIMRKIKKGLAEADIPERLQEKSTTDKDNQDVAAFGKVRSV